MDRTESVVIQVAPDFENQKIQEMQLFGWNLQGRQEIEQQGEAYGRPSFLSEYTGTYVIKTTVKRYVKLHFVRNFNFPNLEKIRQFESEYANLPFPGPASLKGPGCLIVLFSLALIAALIGATEGIDWLGLIELFIYGGFVVIGVNWVKSRKKKTQQAAEVCIQSNTRATEILAEVKSLLN